MAEEFELVVCLPELSTLVSHNLPYEFTRKRVFKEYGLFEIFGKNCYEYSYKNVLPSLMNENFEIYFQYDDLYVWVKLFYVVILLCLVFFGLFLVNRLDFKIDKD